MELPPFRLERFFARHEFAVAHLLCASDCESVTVAELLALETGAAETFAELSLGYTESAGHPDLRREIAGLYQGIDPEEVRVFSGGEEAIFALAQSALRPGEPVVVHFPSYPSLHEVARARGCRVKLWRGREEEGWSLDLRTLSTVARGGTLILNTPHNPTGHVLGPSELADLAEVAREDGLRLVVDEAYRFLEYDPADRPAAGCELDDRAVSLGVLSKSFGLAGLRVGWVASHDGELLERLGEVRDYLTICSSAPSELLAAIALRHREELVARNLGIVRENLERLTAFMDRWAGRFEWVPPRGGPVAYPALVGTEGANRFCRRALEGCGVLLLPGSVFDEGDHRHFRIGFGRRGFRAGLEKLEEWLEEDGRGG
jgi:aspartate/methionine/tyrosine aminotransferase